MTLAVATKFPFGLLGSVGLPLPNGLVLATDSLITTGSGAVVTDRGAKLWHLTPTVGAVFCGDVGLAERGLAGAKRTLRGVLDPKVGDVADAVADYLGRSLEGSGRTQVLVAGIDPEGARRVILLDSDAAFERKELSTGAAIGDATAYQPFDRYLNETLPENKGPGGITALDWLWRVAAALKMTIGSGHPTIGGRIQVALITPGAGWWEQDVQPEMEDEHWERVTASPQEMKTSTHRDTQFRAGSDVVAW